MKNSFLVSVENLRWQCNLSKFGIQTCNDIKTNAQIIGQKKALTALEIGMNMKHRGYNVFVTGFSGTGKMTAIKQMLKKFSNEKCELFDHCFVYNFFQPDFPIALKLKSGDGIRFKKSMEKFLQEILKTIPSVLESNRFQEKKKKILERFQEKKKKILKEFEISVHNKGFELVQVQVGNLFHPDIFPIIDKQPVSIAQAEQFLNEGKISKENFQKIISTRPKLEKQFQSFTKELREIEKLTHETLYKERTKFISPIIEEIINEIKKDFNYEKAHSYLDTIYEAIVNNIDRFVKKDEKQILQVEETVENFIEFSVNVIVDNSRTKGRPIIIENNPRFTNLFGAIGKNFLGEGTWETDFTMIKGGSILKSYGGFIVLNALDVLREPGVWNQLKSILKTGEIEIQSADNSFLGIISTIKPEAIQIDVKVIMIGSDEIYYMLFHNDDEFKKIFKIHSDFDTVIERNNPNLKKYLSFISLICKEAKLKLLDESALTEVIEEAVRISGNKNKITTRFNKISDILKEADFFASKDNSNIIKKIHIEKSILGKKERESLIREKLLENVKENTILIETKGKKIGQINGLAVYQMADFAFGFPSKITAKTSVGKNGIINIERESDLSGETHNKGVLILSGYLRGRFAKNFPLVLTASIAFEQSYSGVDGDSASSTEIYALLSSISEVPICQNIAVTGSVNQHGEIQPIGGVNEKIEGFFDVCKVKKFIGNEGVIIPKQNVDELMLRNDIVDAVQNKKFHIYAVSTIDEGIEILTGMKMGKENLKGEFPKDTIGYLVSKKLKEYSKYWDE